MGTRWSQKCDQEWQNAPRRRHSLTRHRCLRVAAAIFPQGFRVAQKHQAPVAPAAVSNRALRHQPTPLRGPRRRPEPLAMSSRMCLPLPRHLFLRPRGPAARIPAAWACSTMVSAGDSSIKVRSRCKPRNERDEFRETCRSLATHGNPEPSRRYTAGRCRDYLRAGSHDPTALNNRR